MATIMSCNKSQSTQEGSLERQYCLLLVLVSIQQTATDPGSQDGKHIVHQVGNMLPCMLKEKKGKFLERGEGWKRQRLQKRSGKL